MAHVHFQIATYSKTNFLFFNVPWWVPLEFFLASLILVKTFPIRKKFFNLKEIPPQKLHTVLLNLSWTMLIYFGSSFIPETYFIPKNLLLFSMLLAQIMYLKMFYWNSLLEILFIALSGCGFELMLRHLGVFFYLPSPSLIIGIPLWLSFIYGSVALTTRIFNNLE